LRTSTTPDGKTWFLIEEREGQHNIKYKNPKKKKLKRPPTKGWESVKTGKKVKVRVKMYRKKNKEQAARNRALVRQDRPPVGDSGYESGYDSGGGASEVSCGAESNGSSWGCG
jgi:hypothetical protein